MSKTRKKVSRVMIVMTVSLIIASVSLGGALAAEKPYAGTKLKVISLAALPVVGYMHEYFDPRYKEYSGVDLVTDLPPFVDLYTKILTMLKAGSDEYDVMWIDGPWYGAVVETGNLESLNDYIVDQADPKELALDDYPIRTLAYLAMYGADPDNFYVIPNNHAVGMLAYREDLFEDPKYKAEFMGKYGRELAPPKTWQEYLETAQFFTRDTDGDGQIDLWGTNHRYGESNNIIADLLIGFAYSKGATLFDENFKPVMSSPEITEAAKFFLSKEFRAAQPPGVESYIFDDVINNMMYGKVAMYLTENWAIPSLKDAEASPQAANIAFTLVPAWEDPKTGKIHRGTLAGAGGYAINAKSKNKKAAFDYIQFVMSKSRAKQFTMETGVAIRYSTYRDPEVLGKFPYLAANLLQVDVSIGRPQRPWWGEAQFIMGKELMDVITIDKPLEGALKAADSALEKLLTKYEVYKRGDKYVAYPGEREKIALKLLEKLGIEHPDAQK